MAITGIDQLGQSLLAQKDSINRQNRREAKKAARTEQKMALFNGILKFADGAIQDKHKKFFETEHSRTVSRLLKDQQKMLTQRKAYDDELSTSNKSKMGYEIDLVEAELDDDALGGYVDGWLDFTPKRKRQITHGTGVAYDPKKDNGRKAGLYKVVAYNRVAARDAWGEQLKDLDPHTANQQWKEVNPYSKNLLSGALNVLKRTFSGDPAANNEALRSDLLDEIKADTDKYARFREIRTAGFDLDGAIAKLNGEIVLTEADRRGKLKDSVLKTPPGRMVTSTDPVTLPDGRVVSRESETWEQEAPYILNTWVNTSGDVSSLRAPLNSESINPKTKKPFTQKEVQASKDSRTSYPPTKDIVTESVDWYTGANISTTTEVHYNEQGGVASVVTKAVDPIGMALSKNVTIAALRPEVIEATMRDFNLQYTKIASLGEYAVEGKAPSDIVDQSAAFTLGSDAEKLKAATNIYAGSIAVIASKIDDITEGQLGFNKSDTNLIAMQLMFIDKFSEEGLRLHKGKKQLNGLSATTTEVDISKLTLAIDLLRANGSFASFKDGEIISDQNLFDKIESSGLFDAEESLAGNGKDEDGQRFYSTEEVKVIKQIRQRINELDSGSSDRRSLLNTMLLDNQNEDLVNFNVNYSVFDLMTGEKFEADPNTGRLRLTPPAPQETFDPPEKTQSNGTVDPLTETFTESTRRLFETPSFVGSDDALESLTTSAKAAGSLLDAASTKVTDVTSMMQANSMVYDSEGKDLTDLPRQVLEKVLAAGPRNEKWKKRIERALARKSLNSRKDSLLSNPEPTELKLPDTESTVEDKIEFFAKILGDQPNEVEFMKEVVWQESKNGTAAGTYELDSKGEGSYGVAQVDRSGFDQIQGKITDPESRYFKVAETLKEVSGLDLSTVKYEDLNDDLLSVIYGRLYLAQITNEPIPNTVEERAEYWKKYYNTSAGKGTVKGYLINMEERNSKPED
tara:strand:- start:1023 stop:3926 length:2904 start_codon:yes stop_codon:yes gene_type:complete